MSFFEVFNGISRQYILFNSFTHLYLHNPKFHFFPFNIKHFNLTYYTTSLFSTCNRNASDEKNSSSSCSPYQTSCSPCKLQLHKTKTGPKTSSLMSQASSPRPLWDDNDNLSVKTALSIYLYPCLGSRGVKALQGINTHPTNPSPDKD